MEELKKILDSDGNHTFLYILGVEHIIKSSSAANKNITIYFKCKSAFHRKIVHLVAIMYGLEHVSHVPNDKNKCFNYWLRKDIDINDPNYLSGGGHGPHCQDCSMLWKCVPIKLLVINGKPLNLKNTLADYWNSKNQHIDNKNYQASNTCICASFDINYTCQKNMLLPSHEHLEFDENGKLHVLNNYGERTAEFNTVINNIPTNNLNLCKNKNTYINKNVYTKNLYKNKN